MAANADSSTTSTESASRSIRIHFVCRKDTKPEDTCNGLLSTAFKALHDTGMRPRWTDEKYCISLKRRSRSEVFVLSDFECEGFDNLRSLLCSIVGPALVLSCLKEDKPMPKTHQPLLSDCMTGVVACFTSLLKAEREKLRDMILAMKGEVEASLSSECTVLITREVGSRKYKAAVKQGNVLIVTPDWVDAAWERSRLEVFKVKDDAEMCTKYRCPVFAGLIITVSNIRSDKRKLVEETITKNGGNFRGDMKQSEVTHLITDTTDSQKFRVAKSWTAWTVQIVTTSWLFDSVSRGVCLDENDYLTEKACGGGDTSPRRTAVINSKRKQKCSTPTVPNASATAVPSFSFVDPNNTAMTAIMPEAPNTTVMSNVSMAITTSCVNSSDVSNIPSAATDVHERSGLSRTEATVTVPGACDGAAAATTSTITAPEDTPRSPSPSPAPSKKLRSMNETAPTPLNLSKRVDRTSVLSERRPSAAPSVNADVMSQYDEGLIDPNRSFRPKFDLSDAFSYVAKEGIAKPAAPTESPSVVITKQLTTAAEATAAGTSYYNSPVASDEIRRSLTKQIQNAMGRTTLRRHGSGKFFANTTASTVASPTTPASVISTSKGTPSGIRQLTLTQDSQEKSNAVVDWDDQNQKRERQRVGGLLKKPNEPTQSSIGSIHAEDPEAEESEDPETEKSEDVSQESQESRKSEESVKKPSYYFQVTSVAKTDRDRYMEIVKTLGGAVTDSPNFDPSCTHLVAGSFTRNEKLLSAIASGTWVLFPSYLDACEEAGKFVDETAHEYGNPANLKKVSGLREEIARLMKACPHWRQKMQTGDGTKAYHGWNVFLTADRAREDGFMRILNVGGAVVTRNAHEAKEGAITHVIVDPSKKLSPVIAAAVNRFQASGAKCYKSDVIFAYLAGESLDDYQCKPPV